MKALRTIFLSTILIAAMLMPQAANAQAPDSIQASTLLMPLIFERQQTPDSLLTVPQLGVPVTAQGLHLETENAWLKEAQTKRRRENALRYGAMIENPELVKYNMASLPEPPK